MEIVIPAINWLSVLPLLVLCTTALLALFWDIWIKDDDRPLLAWLSLTGLGLAGLASFLLWGQTDLTSFNGMFALDSYALFFNLFFCVVAGTVVIMSLRYLESAGIKHGEYYSLVMFATVGMVVMAAATNLIFIFLGLETMSLALYVLAGIWRQHLTSQEAALKYFLLGAFASGFLLYGIALIYGATGSLQLGAIAAYLETNGTSNLLSIGIGLLIVGFGFKVAAVPFHVWTPDVYQGSPTPVTALMAIGVKAAAFASFVRIFLGTLEPIHDDLAALLWGIAVLTMTVGNITALVQENLKRLLAYSSIAHAGYLLVAMVAGQETGGPALMYYLVAYGITTLGAFGVIVAVGGGNSDGRIEDFQGLGLGHPALAMAMTIFMLSLTGVPPLLGFTGKFYVFNAAIQEGYLWLVVIGVLNSVVSAYYYVRVIIKMYMQENSNPKFVPSLHSPLGAAILVAAVGTVLLGLLPSAAISVAKESFLSLG